MSLPESRVIALLLVATVAPIAAPGVASDLTADDVMRRGIKNVRVPSESNRVKMTLVNRQGQKRERGNDPGTPPAYRNGRSNRIGRRVPAPVTNERLVGNLGAAVSADHDESRTPMTGAES